MKYITTFIALTLPTLAVAQVDELPAYAYDVVAEVTMATTADTACDKISARPKKVQDHIVDLYVRLAVDGVSTNDAAEHFQGEFALEQIAAREVSLREKHGVAPEGVDALCAAIRAEAIDNDVLKGLMRIR